LTVSTKKNIPTLILASGSPRRKKLLEQFNRPFQVHSSSADEHYDAGETPDTIVQTLALRKAADVAQHHHGSVIIGADTIVVHRAAILEKPESPEHAFAMLERLSNDTHQVFTGVSLIKTDKKGTIINKKTFYEITAVTFGMLEKSEIQQYIAGGRPMDKAGGYGIQDDRGAFFVKRIEGDYYNVVGLPLFALHNQLKSFAPELL
jgi:septum formation protein